MVEEHMEAVGGAEQVLLNIIRVRDQAIMVTEVMVGEMGSPRFTKVWTTPGYGKPSDSHSNIRV